jgi:hypothetical protein
MTQVKLGLVQNGWFQTYNGRIYGNKATDLHSKITNKGIIDTMAVKPLQYGEDYRDALKGARPRKNRRQSWKQKQ